MVSEASRHELYNRAQDAFGPDAANTLMTLLPSSPPATEASLLALRDELREFRSEVRARFESIDNRFESIDHRFESIDNRFESIDYRFDSLNGRIDKVWIGIVTGQAAVVAAFITLIARLW